MGEEVHILYQVAWEKKSTSCTRLHMASDSTNHTVRNEVSISRLLFRQPKANCTRSQAAFKTKGVRQGPQCG